MVSVLVLLDILAMMSPIAVQIIVLVLTIHAETSFEAISNHKNQNKETDLLIAETKSDTASVDNSHDQNINEKIAKDEAWKDNDTKSDMLKLIENSNNDRKTIIQPKSETVSVEKSQDKNTNAKIPPNKAWEDNDTKSDILKLMEKLKNGRTTKVQPNSDIASVEKSYNQNRNAKIANHKAWEDNDIKSDILNLMEKLKNERMTNVQPKSDTASVEETSHNQRKNRNAKIAKDRDNDTKSNVLMEKLKNDRQSNNSSQLKSDMKKIRRTKRDDEDSVIWDDCPGKLHYEFIDGVLECVPGDASGVVDRVFGSLEKCPKGTRRVILGNSYLCLEKKTRKKT